MYACHLYRSKYSQYDYMKKGILLTKKYRILIFWTRLSVEENWSGKIPVDKSVQRDAQNILSMAKSNLLYSLQHFLLPRYISPDV